MLTYQREGAVLLFHSQPSQQLSTPREVCKTSGNIDMAVKRNGPDSWELELLGIEERINFTCRENVNERLTNLEELRVKEGIGDEEDRHSHSRFARRRNHGFLHDPSVVMVAYSRGSISGAAMVGGEMKKVEERVGNEGEYMGTPQEAKLISTIHVASHVRGNLSHPTVWISAHQSINVSRRQKLDELTEDINPIFTRRAVAKQTKKKVAPLLWHTQKGKHV